MANNDEILKAIESLKKDMVTKSDLEASEKRVKTELKSDLEALEKRLKRAILDSQEDSINILKEFFQTGFDMHEKRIETLEDAAGIPHPDRN